LKLKTVAILFVATFAAAGIGLGSTWYAYKNAMIQRDIRTRVMDVQDVMPRLVALAQRAAADPAGPLSSPGVERAQLEAIAEMARQARDSALMARLAVSQMSPLAAPAAPDRTRCVAFEDSLAANAAGRSPAYGAFVARYLAICTTNRDATFVDALEHALGSAP
jgi:hypothetical protein